jgi:hypothetical protein
VVLPEVITKYGAGKAVALSGKWVSAPASGHFHKGSAEFSASLEVTMTIDSETALQATFDGINGDFGIHSSSGKVFGHVTNASVGTMGKAFTTTLGITADQFHSRLQDTVDEGVTELNEMLQNGVVIPSIMGIDVSDVEISMMEGYLELGMSLSPTSWTQIAAAMSSWKAYLLS